MLSLTLPARLAGSARRLPGPGPIQPAGLTQDKGHTVMNARWGASCFCWRPPSILALLCALIPSLIAPTAAAAPPQIPVLNWQPRSDWVNVKTQVTPRALGNGVADDTAALQAAFAGLHDGATVYLPPGTYRITRTLAITGPLTGILIVGNGRATRLVWDGPAGGRMILVNGVAYSRFVGLTLDGKGKAAVGLYHNSDRRFETEVRHQDLAFLHFTDAGLLVDPARKLALAEAMFENCLFQDCRRGAAFTQFNDYDYTFDGCEFRQCDTGVECNHGNFYIRDCHFEGSRIVDIQASPEHGSSIRRCSSYGSNAFVHYVQPVAPMTIEDCRVAGWKSTDGAITLNGAPIMLFDCVFTHPPAGTAPVQVLRDGQRLIVSQNRVEGAPYVVRPRPGARLYTVPAGRRSGSLRSASQSFLQEHVRLPGRVFDARRDFGARDDGKTDDTTAIQKTIDAARAYGRDAIAYLPTGVYVITRTLHMDGESTTARHPSTGYFVGGSGFLTRLVWKGAPGGTMIAVKNPQRDVLQAIMVGSADAGAMDNGADVLQTGSGGRSSMTYDGVYVYGMYQKQPFRKGLVFSDLGPGDLVMMPYVQGNIRVVDSARATIVSSCSYEGSIVVEGKKRVRDGFLGFMTRLTTGSLHPVYLRDSQSIVMSDSYVEQADSGYLLEGSPGDPPGRATIQGAKIEFTVPKDNPNGGVSFQIDNYHGKLFVGTDQFYNDPPQAKIRQQGRQPVDLYLAGCSFYGTKLDVQKQVSAHLFLLGSEAMPAGNPQPEDNLHDLSSLVPMFDDLRHLGELDLRLNHPSQEP